MEKELKKLGLTWNEIKVYLSLLEIGETSVGAIIDDLKIHRQLAYNALGTLEEKNMVIKMSKNGTYHFKITDPKAIIENIEQKELIARQVCQRIQKKIKERRHKKEVNFYNGATQVRNFMGRMYRNCPVGSLLYVLMGEGKKYKNITGTETLKKHEKIRQKRKITHQVVTSEKFKKDILELDGVLDFSTRKINYLPFGISNPITTMIWQESITMHFWDGPFIIEIKDADLRETYLEQFKQLQLLGKNNFL